VVEFLFLALICSLIMNVYPAVNILIIVAFGLLYLLYGRRHKNPCPVADPSKWVLLACGYWIASYLMTTAPLENFFSFDFLRRDGNLFFAYLPLIWIGSFGLSLRQVQKLVRMYLGLMSSIAAIGAIQFAAGVGILPNFLPLIPDSLTMVHPGETTGLEFHALIQAHNAAGGTYAIASLVALGLILFSEKRPRIASWPTAWLALNLLGLAMTKSRGSYLGFCVAAAVMSMGSSVDLKRAIKPLTIIVVPLVLSVLFIPGIMDRVIAIGAGDADSNIVVRLEMWPKALNDIIASPIVGIGFGRFNDDNPEFWGIPNLFYIATKADIENNDGHAHNSFLHFAAEGGVIGLALMCAIWLSVYRWAKWAASRLPVGTFGYALARAISAAVIVECLISMTDHMMASAVTTIAIFTLFGLLKNLVDCPELRRSAALVHQRLPKQTPAVIPGLVGPALGTAT
jgi:O-antigen ligase